MKLLSTFNFQLSTIALILAFAGCTPQAPQRPSQRSGQTSPSDSITLAMVELHQRLADAADIELNRYIKEHPGQWFSQDDGSWWMRLQVTGDRQQVTGDKLQIRLITRDLEGKLLSDVEGEYELGKCQLPEAVESVITLNFKLSTFNFKVLAPWYVAYGSQGNDAIPGYQNVIIEVYLL